MIDHKYRIKRDWMNDIDKMDSLYRYRKGRLTLTDPLYETLHRVSFFTP